MARVSYYVATSLDGYIAGPQGEMDWLHPYETPNEDYGYADFLARVDGLVMGRRSFEVVRKLSSTWPYPGRPCWVLGRDPAGIRTWIEADGLNEVMPWGGDLAGLQQAWRARGLAHLWLVGGGVTATALMGAGLLHELILSVAPVTLGQGVPLFAPSAAPVRTWRVRAHERFPNGVVQTHYIA